MKLDVELTEKFKEQLADLLDYLELRFGKRSAFKLYQAFLVSVDNIRHFPYLYPTIDGQGTWRCVLVSKSILFYEVDGNVVRILALRDGRQDWKSS
jgi:plasmid stabilization system protein ParE